MITDIVAGFAERFRHLTEDMQPAFACLLQGDLHDLLVNAGDLDVHLQ